MGNEESQNLMRAVISVANVAARSGKTTVAVKLSAGWVLGSWRELGRILHGSVAVGEDGRPCTEVAASCRKAAASLFGV